MDITTDIKGCIHTVRLYGEIGPPENYTELFELLDSVTPQDSVNMRINTLGGYLDTAISIVEGMRNCQGLVTTIAEGNVASGGSLIYFSGHQLLAGEFAEVMLHDASIGGVGGKFNEIESRSKSSQKLISNLYHAIYGPYFTKKEINKVLKGQDLYLDASELRTVLDKFCERMAGGEDG